MIPQIPLTKPLPLHIPDGFLSLPVALFFWAVAIGVIALAVRRAQTELGERQIPLMGVMAAFIFAAQMINFPVAGGTSGHLLGGALAAIALGPWAAIIVMASVVGVQALIFQDGGLVVMGANIFNMGLMAALIGFGLYRGVAGSRRSVRLSVAGLAAWLSVMAGALATALQLWLSGTADLRIVVPAMLGIHALIGLGEALITVTALAFISRLRPDLVQAQRSLNAGGRGWILAGLTGTFAVVLLSPIASANPDGLERVAADLGFTGRASPSLFEIFPDYRFPFIQQASISTILAGALGVLVIAVLTVFLLRAIRRGNKPESLVNATESDAR